LQYPNADFSEVHMARPKHKTEVAALKIPAEVRDLWKRRAAAEVRSLTIMFEVMVRSYESGLGTLIALETAGAAVAGEEA
jgi:hypothetical protein